MSPRSLHFSGGQILLNGELIAQDLWVLDGKVCEPLAQVEYKVDATGMILSPGFIDLQLNGAFGVDFTCQPERADEVAEQLPRTGVTSFLATVVSSKPSHYSTLLPKLRPKEGEGKRATRLGIHAEALIDASKTGAHQQKFLQAECGGEDVLQECYGSLEGIKMITLAPELPFALEMIRVLKERNVIVAGGHSSARYEQCLFAADAGMSMATHLFNAMSLFHHRDPGLIGLALMQAGFFFSIIADGIHCHPLALQLAWRAHPEGLLLVSDAMAAMGMPDGRYRLGRRRSM